MPLLSVFYTKKSLETYLLYFLVVVGFILVSLLACCTLLANLSTGFVIVLSTLAALIYAAQARHFYIAILSPFFRLTNEIEAIKCEDYGLMSRSPFFGGVSEQVFSELHLLGQQLRVKKRLFDEKNLLMYSLIEQLDSPVLVLDHNKRMIHANQAFSLWLGHDWRISRLMKSHKLGLMIDDSGHWQLNVDTVQERKNNKSMTYHVRSSRFFDGDDRHQLLILTDISKELRATQKKSWQQLIRILGHEINNTIAPIKSLAQSLLTEIEHEQHRRVLEFIADRSEGLATFVKHYSNIYKDYPLSIVTIDLTVLFDEIVQMHPSVIIKSDLKCNAILVDPNLFKQVLNNIVKNAVEATVTLDNNNNCSEQVIIDVQSWEMSGCIHLNIGDYGCGIQNPENLFVPFYTTKLKGQGIGLNFSRHIIEQHGGTLTLLNRVDQSGAIASIVLPAN